MHLELTEGANTVISFYSSSLVSCVGSRFKPPSLDFLARQWFNASSMGLEVTSWLVTDAIFVLDELRQAIRILFDASVANLSDEEAIKITERWQHHGKQSFHHRPASMLILLSDSGVPALQPDAEKETLNAALALFVCGCVTSEKYALLSTKYHIFISQLCILIFNLLLVL
jgi:WD repeat-containing protein 7